VVVTGGLGFLGRRVTQALRDTGHDVVVLDNAFRAPNEEMPGIELVLGDIRDADLVERVTEHADLVYHLAAIQGTGNFYSIPDEVLDVNVTGALNIARAAARNGVGRVFFASSSEVYGEPTVFPTSETEPLVVPSSLNPRWSYGGSKLLGELVFVNFGRRHGFEYTIARFHNVYGPRMGWDHVIPQFIRRLELHEEFVVQGDGRQTRSFCWVGDAVDATVAAGSEPRAANQIMNIGNPSQEHSINNLIALLAKISGKPIVPRHIPFEGGGTQRRMPDVSKAEELLSWKARTTFEDGLVETYRWYAQALEETETR
jgi:nucleoside-diphosphate-sugar epimerase